MLREVSDLHLSEIMKECNPSLEEFLAHKRLKMKCWYHKPGSPTPSESQNSVDAFHSFPCQIMSVLHVFILKHQGTSWKSPTPPEGEVWVPACSRNHSSCRDVPEPGTQCLPGEHQRDTTRVAFHLLRQQPRFDQSIMVKEKRKVNT